MKNKKYIVPAICCVSVINECIMYTGSVYSENGEDLTHQIDGKPTESTTNDEAAAKKGWFDYDPDWDF